MKQKLRWISLAGLFVFCFAAIGLFKKINFNTEYKVGQRLDSLNGVYVYYNGGVDHVEERNTIDDYNLGLKYQCVEFVKRYYYLHLNHKMPDSYGHARDFFDTDIKDGGRNRKRDLIQYSNSSHSKPKRDDLVIFKGSLMNKYGHVAIVSDVTDDEVEIIQQNPGPFGKSREVFHLTHTNGKWKIEKERIVGWLRKE